MVERYPHNEQETFLSADPGKKTAHYVYPSVYPNVYSGLVWAIVSMTTAVAWSASGMTAIAQSLPISPPPSATIAQTPTTASVGYLLFVNPTVGNDSGDGSQRSPFKTITHALQVARGNTVILLTPGTYSAETGEQFPLMLRPGVIIQGDPAHRGRGIVIRGGGTFLSPTFAQQNITLLGANQASLIGVTLTNPNSRGYGLWIESSSPTITSNTFSGSTHDGISVTGNGAPLVQGNTFIQNGANGITLYGTSQAQVRDNRFERTGFGINVAQQATPVITGNQISANRSGVVVQGNARPTLRNNIIEGSQEDGLVAIAQSQPNLGTTNDPGNNIFRNNARHDVNARVNRQTIPAAGNTMSNTTGQLDTSSPGIMTATVPAAAIAPPPRPALPPTAITPPSAASFPSPTVLTQPPSNPASSNARTTPTPVSSTPTAVTIPVLPPARPSSPAVHSSPPVPTAIEIPVPPPASSGAVRPGIAPQTLAAQRSPQLLSVFSAQVTQPTPTAIDIPVPPPESSGVPAAPSAGWDASSAPRSLAASVPSANVLPVPDGNAPLGNIGDLPTVMVSRDPLQRAAGAPPSVPSRAAALGLRYRVVVESADDGTQAMVRSLIPGAFRTYVNGQVVMQAGAYSDRTNADEMVQMLLSNGLRATIESLE